MQSVSLSSYLLSVFLLFILSFTSLADDRGLIWKFEKNGNHSFLMGSVHFADASFYPLSPQIMAAYSRADSLLVEVDDALLPIADQQKLMKRYGTYPKGQTIHDHLSPKTISAFRRLFNEFQAPLAQFETFRPGLLALTLTSFQANKLGYSPEQGIDRYFLQKARFKKQIRQIETFEFQMSLLSQLPEDDSILLASIENMSDYKVHWQGTMAAWKKGDAQALYELAIGEPIKQFPKLEKFFDVLFFSRHNRMVNAAEECVKSGEVCFIVLGAGHMVGERGVVEGLKRKGYIVSQL